MRWSVSEESVGKSKTTCMNMHRSFFRRNRVGGEMRGSRTLSEGRESPAIWWRITGSGLAAKQMTFEEIKRQRWANIQDCQRF